MNPTCQFALEKHSGPYEFWPARTRLLRNGAPTNTFIPGYNLLEQFELGQGYLLATDYDCPFEESVSLILLDRDVRISSYHPIGAAFASVWLKEIQWTDGEHFTVFFEGMKKHLACSIRKRSIPFIYPKLKVTWRK